MGEFTWGDTVKLSENAAVPRARRGSIAEVCGIREIESQEQAQMFDAPIGTKLYLVEFGDGASVEVPGGLLETAVE